MKLRDIIPVEMIMMALDNVRAHKFRSFLTVLGIVIGVTTVIAIASILTGLRTSMIRLVEEYGTDNIYAFHLSTGFRLGPRDRAERARKPLTLADGKEILAKADSVDDISYVGFLEGGFNDTIIFEKFSYKRGDLQAVTANYAKNTNLALQEGRFISEVDDQHRRDVMVIGMSVAEAIFPNRNKIVGNKVLMGGSQFEIIGVLEKKKTTFLGENEVDNAVYIPFQTGHKISPNSKYLLMVIRAKSGQLAAALDQAEQILRRQRGVKFNEKNNFDLNTADHLIEQFDGITKAIGLIAIAVSSVGLLVGGIGVMNIMLVSVTERTQEIGVRKALGARRRDIVTQFLFESMTLTFIGGVIGLILAAIASQAVAFFAPSLPASIPLWAVVAGLGVSIAVGLIFGVWPARKAARLDPIECLRYE
jgi:putative ABC transport system permease protein